MKKNLAKKIVLGLLTGAVLISSSVAWAAGTGQVFDNNTENISNAGGDYALAVGSGCSANGNNSISIGANTKDTSTTMASGNGSIAIGAGSFSGGNDSIAIGTGSDITGSRSVAIGANAKVTMLDSVALGSGSYADTDYVVSVGRAANGDDAGVYRKIVNVKDGTNANDAATYGQVKAVKDIVGSGKVHDVDGKVDGSTVSYFNFTDGDNLTETIQNMTNTLDPIVKKVFNDFYTEDEVDTKLASKANVADVYTRDEANATFVKIEDNKISNKGDITFDVGTTNKDNIVTISTTGITVGSTSTHIDGNGVYVGAHNFEGAKAAMNDDGEVKGVNATFTGNVTAANLYDKTQIDNSLALKANSADVYQKTETYNKTEVDTKLDGKAEKATTLEGYGITDAYTKTEIDGMLGGSNASVAGLSQRLDKTNAKINKVGAGAAALAALHPLEYDPDDKLTFSAGMGNYAGENAAALGAFYRPNEKFMVSLGGTMGNGENMVNLGLSIGLDKPNGYAKLSKRELIQKVNAMEAKYEAVEAEKEAMKAEMAEMKAMLQAILAKK